MGYSLTRHSIIRNLPQLRQLASARTTLRFPTDNPKKLAYKLREAVAACGEVEEYASLYVALVDNYRFKEEENAVVAVYFTTSVEGEEHSSTSPAPTPRFAPEKKTMPAIFSLTDVLTVALKFTNEDELYFPDAGLNTEQKVKLHGWIQGHGWEYIDHTQGGGTGLTLTKKELPEGVAWQPQAESEEVSK